jgi:hypothetical protein
MSNTSANGGDPQAEPPDSPAAPVSGVRTEHQLRIQLKDAMERNTRFERALRESVAFAYGRRELADLRKLKAALWAAGFPDPNPKRREVDEDEAQAPASTSP